MASTATTAVTDMEKQTWVTNMEQIPVRISKDEAPTPLSVVGPLFISSLLFHLTQTLLRFSLFRSVYSSFHNRLDLITEPAFLLGVLFSQFIHVCFSLCKTENVLFILVQQTGDSVASLG